MSKKQPSANVIKSALKGSNSEIEAPIKTPNTTTSSIQFRIFVGSYEHNLLCLSVILDPKNEKEPVFQPIFHFQAHSLSIKTIDLAKRYLVTGSNDEHIRIYDLQKRKELGTLLSHQGTITALKFSKEINTTTEETQDNLNTGKWLLSGSEDGKIIIWRTKDWEVFATLKGHTKRINDLSIHPSGKVAISVSEDQTIRLWNLLTGKKASILKIKGKDHLGQSGQFVKWSTDGKQFLVGLSNQTLIYNTSNGKIFKKLKFKSTIMCMDIVKFNDGKDDNINEWLGIGFSDGSIGFYDYQSIISQDKEEEEEKIWDSKPEEVDAIYRLQGHTNRIKDFYFLQSQESTENIPLLVSVSSDGKIVIWNLQLRDQVAIYDTGERLNCIVCAPEHIEKIDTMKRRFEDTPLDVSESEYETDGEEISKIMIKGEKKKSKKNKNKKNKKRKVNVTLE
ncbi:MAK11 [Candida jiufengensis]|uniref:MAK11 n=1 Tax=Candida jiufengensis TaxID=497108 RepID=UPI002225B00B|nr:MAK11 [Candida jiufengensis]KAI5954965.1 MAK11 [Candida jiufengensis]